MPKRYISTPSYIKPTFKKEKRIVIPQPVERPLHVRGKDVVKWEKVKPEIPWFILHRRGVHRIYVGQDPLEARAISKEQVRGTLPERILYQALNSLLRMYEPNDYTFQSSLQGGRLYLGGIVADFLFPQHKIVIQVQGSTHKEFLRMRKDEEQQGTLEDMGYRVFAVDETTIYNEYLFEEWLRRTFNLVNGWAGDGGSFGYAIPSITPDDMNWMLDMATQINTRLDVIYGEEYNVY